MRGATTETPWILSHTELDEWLETVASLTEQTFADVGKIRVGIKTTADKVFIRKTWSDLPEEHQPEAELLRPLLTHHVVERWRAKPAERIVLYPHVPAAKTGKQTPVDLDEYPHTAIYLEENRERLEGRKYVIAGGRKWFEIWVPQDPALWLRPKLVFPDIAETPRFLLDESGAVVNGDCYWMSVEKTEPELVSLMLAVANSSFAVAFYDAVCGNRLYAGRRRFITQYVNRFPLPKIDAERLARIHELVGELVVGAAANPGDNEAELDRIVWESFGVSAPAAKT